MTGRVVHFEVPYDDADRARSFYSEVFGWNIQHMPEFDYDFVQTGPTEESGMPSEPGFIGGGMFPRQEDVGRPIVTVEVDDMTAAIAAVTDHGGAAIGDPMQIGEMGIAGYFKDSEGNLMGLWQSLGTG